MTSTKRLSQVSSCHLTALIIDLTIYGSFGRRRGTDTVSRIQKVRIGTFRLNTGWAHICLLISGKCHWKIKSIATGSLKHFMMAPLNETSRYSLLSNFIYAEVQDRIDNHSGYDPVWNEPQALNWSLLQGQIPHTDIPCTHVFLRRHTTFRNNNIWFTWNTAKTDATKKSKPSSPAGKVIRNKVK